MEDKLHSFLAEWALNFIRNKDILAKKIESIEKNRDGFDFYIKHRDREQYVIVMPNLLGIEAMLAKIENIHHFTVVTLNSTENFEFLVKSWNKLASFKTLSIIFVNPFSGTDKKWIICPYTHNRICDEDSLKTGLRSMFETVEQADGQSVMAKMATG